MKIKYILLAAFLTSVIFSESYSQAKDSTNYLEGQNTFLYGTNINELIDEVYNEYDSLDDFSLIGSRMYEDIIIYAFTNLKHPQDGQIIKFVSKEYGTIYEYSYDWRFRGENFPDKSSTNDKIDSFEKIRISLINDSSFFPVPLEYTVLMRYFRKSADYLRNKVAYLVKENDKEGVFALDFFISYHIICELLLDFINYTNNTFEGKGSVEFDMITYYEKSNDHFSGYLLNKREYYSFRYNIDEKKIYTKETEHGIPEQFIKDLSIYEINKETAPRRFGDHCKYVLYSNIKFGLGKEILIHNKLYIE